MQYKESVVVQAGLRYGAEITLFWGRQNHCVMAAVDIKIVWYIQNRGIMRTEQWLMQDEQ